jgi:hypothetical protein
MYREIVSKVSAMTAKQVADGSAGWASRTVGTVVSCAENNSQIALPDVRVFARLSLVN